MSALDVIALVAAALEAIAKLIASGVGRDAALERIRSIAADARAIDGDVDRIASGE